MELNSKPHRKSVTHTIRIDSEIMDNLTRLAQKERTSLNQVIATALRTYTQWENSADRLGMVEIHDKALGLLFESMDEKTARGIGRRVGQNSWTESIVYVYKDLNYQNLFSILENRGQFGHFFVFEKSEEPDVDVLILNHHYGHKATVYLSEALKAVLEATRLPFDIEEMEDQVLVRVNLRPLEQPVLHQR